MLLTWLMFILFLQQRRAAERKQLSQMGVCFVFAQLFYLFHRLHPPVSRLKTNWTLCQFIYFAFSRHFFLSGGGFVGAKNKIY
jgi:hypothetical protein